MAEEDEKVIDQKEFEKQKQKFAKVIEKLFERNIETNKNIGVQKSKVLNNKTITKRNK